MSQIVDLNVSVIQAGTPPSLQSMAAFVSHGGTNLAAGTSQYLTTPAALTSLILAPAAISAISWTSEVVTVDTAAPHGYTNGDIVNLTIAGVTPVAYNGTYPCTITGASSFTYPLASNPGAETVLGTWQSLCAAELTEQNSTWWAQGSGTLGPYVLEFGPLGDVTGIAALAMYLTDYQNIAYVPGANGYFYNYIVSRAWSAQSTYLALVKGYAGLNKMTYFGTTLTTGDYTNYVPAASCKAVVGQVEAPTVLPTEFAVVATVFDICNMNPTSSTKSRNLCYAFQYGVTQYPIPGNQTLLAALQAAGVNIVGPAAEGGLSEEILQYATTMDGMPFNWWYSIDWLQLNANQQLSAAVIDGSNNPTAPLFYDQPGINTLQSVFAGTCGQGVSYGLILGSIILTELDPTTFANNSASGQYNGLCAVNAVPFQTWLNANPADYAEGLYGGYSASFSPLLGFKNIVVNLTATQFA